jgi:RimJ/RimL family protein N-acetyltransferase
MRIETARLVLRSWREADRAPLAAMHADPVVMEDYGGPLTRAESDAKFDRYAGADDALGYARWVVEYDNRFVGYVGIMPIWPSHPVAPGLEIGWRLIRQAWGHGYATEAARAVLRDGFSRCGFGEVLSYTDATNRRSQAVMGRLGLIRDAGRDFESVDNGIAWRGLVWVAKPDMSFG